MFENLCKRIINKLSISFLNLMGEGGGGEREEAKIIRQSIGG